MAWRGCISAGIGLSVALACGDAGPIEKTVSEAEPGSRVVAHLNGEPIEADELRASFPGAMAGDVRHALDATIARRLVAQEARRRGLDVAPEVQARLAAFRREAAAREDAILRDALMQSLDAEVAVDEAALRAQYEQAAPLRFMSPQLRVRRVAFPSAEAARAEDERLGAEGRLDPAASEEIGPAPVDELVQQGVMRVLQLQEPGQRIVVPQGNGFALVELIERLPPSPLPFEKVRPQLEAQLRAQRAGEAFQQLVETLRAQAKLEVDEAALAAEAAKAPGPGELARPRALAR
jgi:parvulin-like peptidyl-prolyl isomerase